MFMCRMATAMFEAAHARWRAEFDAVRLSPTHPVPLKVTTELGHDETEPAVSEFVLPEIWVTPEGLKNTVSKIVQVLMTGALLAKRAAALGISDAQFHVRVTFQVGDGLPVGVESEAPHEWTHSIEGMLGMQNALLHVLLQLRPVIDEGGRA